MEVKVEKEAEPAAKPERSQDSDEMPLVMAVQTAPTDAEAAAEAAHADQPQEAKILKTYAKKKKVQETGREDAPDQAPETTEADAEEAKSPRARRGKSQEAGQLGSAAGAPEDETLAHVLEPKSPKAKRKRQSDVDQLGGQDDASDPAGATEAKHAAQKRRKAKTAPAPGKAGKGTPAGRRTTKSREATPEVPVEAEAAPDQAAGQRAAAGAAGQQATPAKTAPVSELEHIREGLQKAEEAHERKLGELRHLDAQVCVAQQC